MPFNLLVLFCLTYVLILFAVAYLADRAAERKGDRFLRSPLLYTLSLSIYCTAWTFYGAVGYATRSGLEFLTIYLGPTLVFVGWWWVLRKLVRIGRQEGVTSIADLISSRYGKSNGLGILVTLIMVVATTPYIALQLQSVTLSFNVFASDAPQSWALPDRGATAVWVAGGLAVFTILFGTRNLDANERHHGIVMAIAVEAVVKLVALMAVGIFVVWGLAGGPADVLARIDSSAMMDAPIKMGRWTSLIAVSAFAVLTLPRMFQVMVVENADEGNLARASWAFPAYLFLMSLFILPIAAVGLEKMGEGANPDLFVLTLPLSEGYGWLAMLAFLGGFSSSTSMVIVEAIALSTMVSNHVIMPLWLKLRPRTERAGALRMVVLNARRLSIVAVLALGLAYYRLSGGSAALAAIGLISFTGVSQVLPALIGGITWRGGNKAGAAAGMIVGVGVWAYTLLLPSFGADVILPASVLTEGAFGLSWLRPEALFGTQGMDPLVHSVMWSLVLNAAAYTIASIATFPGPVERVQGAAFVNVFDREAQGGGLGWSRGQPEPEALLEMAQRILGEEPALTFFEAETKGQGKAGYLPDPTPDMVANLERRLAGAVGAATAHAMIAPLFGQATVTVEDLMAVANETAQIMEYSARLEAQQDQLTRTARQLGEANALLTQLSEQKDAFLSQISHELRTPMTSIRAFSEILAEGDLAPEMVTKSGRIIHEEAIRLTRLLDDLLDLSVLERGSVQLNVSTIGVAGLIDRALAATADVRPERGFDVVRDLQSEALFLHSDPDRLVQVLINLISNARKYCDAVAPRLQIVVKHRAGRVTIDVIDNGHGIPKADQSIIFEKFARLTDESRSGGAGLGLAICREVMANLGGTITYLPGRNGAAFRIALPLRFVQKT
jgi:Na+/proline symporter/nitrogen-specific signal transduction histidine kinase